MHSLGRPSQVNLEFSRENPTRWKAWLASLRRIARDPRNIVAANNKYDAEYIKYFAGIEALYIPSYCGYAAKAQYSPVKGKSLLPNLTNPDPNPDPYPNPNPDPDPNPIP